jgi:tryptophan synthase alpha chain
MIFDMVARVSKKVNVPLVFLTYLNPIFKYGYERFCSKCKEVGIDGLIIPDMPYEEKGELKPYADKCELDIISFIAPSSIERIKMIAKDSTGYVYMVPSMDEEAGETSIDLDEVVRSVREVTDTPLVFGFKMNTVEQIAKKSTIVDGVIVDNSIVKLIEANGEDAGKYIHEYIKTVVERINK